MLSIRKFVGFTKVAAGLGAALVLALSTQSAIAQDADSTVRTSAMQARLSPGCVAAIQSLKTTLINDRQEKALERAEAKLNPDLAADQAEDAIEREAVTAQFGAVRDACAPEIVNITTVPTPPSVSPPSTSSDACTSALQAWKAVAKAILAQGTRPTPAQMAQLQSLLQATKAACGIPSWINWHEWEPPQAAANR